MRRRFVIGVLILSLLISEICFTAAMKPSAVVGPQNDEGTLQFVKS